MFFWFPNESAKEIFLFQNPFTCVIEELPHNFQFDVINLQCNDILKRIDQEKNLVEFYK